MVTQEKNTVLEMTQKVSHLNFPPKINIIKNKCKQTADFDLQNKCKQTADLQNKCKQTAELQKQNVNKERIYKTNVNKQLI